MLRCLIIDDEKNGREVMQLVLEKHLPQVQVIGTAKSVDTAVQSINEHQPDLVFLDVELNNQTGFDIFDRLEHRTFSVIFVTAHEEYAIEAIRSNAIDYLLKPIQIAELKGAVAKVLERRAEQTKDDLQAILELAKKDTSVDYDRISIPTKNGFEFVLQEEIVYCESDSNYTVFHLANKSRLVASKTLKAFECKLNPDKFFRIHRSYIINLNRVRKYLSGKGGEVVMDNGSYVTVSRDRKQQFLGRIG